MQRALKISERYLRTQWISVSSYFLSEARLIDYGGNQTPHELRWFFRWIASKGRQLKSQFQWLVNHHALLRCRRIEQIVGRERRGRVSQLDWSGDA
jgi:hypothetical protein